ncbi:MAG: hypothetical protein CMH83_12410 [Nocardioides sp.]|nr:hypothetical protein [Nocardioides sp.]
MTEPATTTDRPLRPLALVAWGFVVVIADLRFDGLDVLPDPLGFALVAAGLAQVRAHHPAYGVGAAAGALGVLISVPAVLGEPTGLLATLAAVAQTVVVFATCTALVATVPRVRGSADVLRWADLGLMLVSASFAFALDSGSTGDDGLALTVAGLVLVALGVAVWFVVVVVRASQEQPVPRFR